MLLLVLLGQRTDMFEVVCITRGGGGEGSGCISSVSRDGLQIDVDN